MQDEVTPRKAPMGPTELLSRGATYGTLLACAAGFLWLILYLFGQQNASINGIKSDVEKSREIHTKTREELIAFRGEVALRFDKVDARLAAVEARLGNLEGRLDRFEARTEDHFTRLEALLLERLPKPKEK